MEIRFELSHDSHESSVNYTLSRPEYWAGTVLLELSLPRAGNPNLDDVVVSGDTMVLTSAAGRKWRLRIRGIHSTTVVINLRSTTWLTLLDVQVDGGECPACGGPVKAVRRDDAVVSGGLSIEKTACAWCGRSLDRAGNRGRWEASLKDLRD